MMFDTRAVRPNSAPPRVRFLEAHLVAEELQLVDEIGACAGVFRSARPDGSRSCRRASGRGRERSGPEKRAGAPGATLERRRVRPEARRESSRRAASLHSVPQLN